MYARSREKAKKYDLSHYYGGAPFFARGRKLATMKKEEAREGYERASVSVGAKAPTP
jgi:hypothetical protein